MDMEQNTGMTAQAVRAEYALTREEIRAALYQRGMLRSHRNRSIVQSVVAAIGALLFIFRVVDDPYDVFAYFIIAVCAGVIVFSWIYPKRFETALLDKVHDETVLRTVIEPSGVTVKTDDQPGGWICAFDENLAYEQTEDLLILQMDKGRQLLVIPKRALSGEDTGRVVRWMKESGAEEK